MAAQQERAHGVTPVLNRDYRARTAAQQAAFVLTYLRPGMHLLDVGCGPGTITLGLARAAAPGHVTGIDHDAKHIEAAKALAAEEGVANVSFQLRQRALAVLRRPRPRRCFRERRLHSPCPRRRPGGQRSVSCAQTAGLLRGA